MYVMVEVNCSFAALVVGHGRFHTSRGRPTRENWVKLLGGRVLGEEDGGSAQQRSSVVGTLVLGLLEGDMAVILGLVRGERSARSRPSWAKH
jgi:hypothetical protein